ncbi:MAG: hypothetical protein ACTSRP_09960 [Candidatus Helarchaeota archaeon]
MYNNNKSWFFSLTSNEVFLINIPENSDPMKLNEMIKKSNLLSIIFEDIIEFKEYIESKIKNQQDLNPLFENIQKFKKIFLYFDNIIETYIIINDKIEKINPNELRFSFPFFSLDYDDWLNIYSEQISLLFIFINCIGLIIHGYIRYKISKILEAYHLLYNSINYLIDLSILAIKYLLVINNNYFKFKLEDYVKCLTKGCYDFKLKFSEKPYFKIKVVDKKGNKNCNKSFIDFSIKFFSENSKHPKEKTHLQSIKKFKSSFDEKIAKIRNRSPLAHGLYPVDPNNMRSLDLENLLENFIDLTIKEIFNYLYSSFKKTIYALLFVKISILNDNFDHINNIFWLIRNSNNFSSLLNDLFIIINNNFKSFSDFLVKFSMFIKNNINNP